ncbi:MAG TPA: hypothetical protein VFG72_13675 [Marmoricola sp.]|nr:hypothetical protein [Marmoricola sp.]
MALRIVLHIGAPKTGTTYLQRLLFQNQAPLAEAGVLVPGRRRLHASAATSIRQPPNGPHRVDWERLVAESQAWPGTVVLSNEWFCMANARSARRALSELGDVEKHVVFTARDFVAQVPAAWQESLKLGISTRLEEFVSSLETDRGRWRWSVLDPALVLERWRNDLPAEHLHVVTVPPTGSEPTLLWRRFAEACGFPADACDTEVSQTRESVSVEAARLLQLAGPRLRDALDADTSHWSEAYRWIQRYLSHDLLGPRGGRKIRLRERDVDALRTRSESSVKSLTAAGYDVVGDLDDLTSAEPAADAVHPDDVTDAEVLDVALPLLAQLLGDVRAENQRASEAERRLRATSADAGREHPGRASEFRRRFLRGG